MANKAKNLWEFKKNLGEELKPLQTLPWSDLLKYEYKRKLFREIANTPEYQELRTAFSDEKRSEEAKEKLFQEAFSHAQKLNPSLSKEDFRGLLMWKTEAKETATKSLEFEKDTFKIDSTWWKETKKWWRKVKINDTGDVTEYVDWDQKWEQIFITYDAFIREVSKAKKCSQEEVEKKYLMTLEELQEKMKDKPSGSDAYKDFYDKEVNGHLAGYWTPNDEIFYNVGDRSDVWLVGGNYANFYQNKWTRSHYYRNFGFSGRLLQN